MLRYIAVARDDDDTYRIHLGHGYGSTQPHDAMNVVTCVPASIMYTLLFLDPREFKHATSAQSQAICTKCVLRMLCVLHKRSE